jgi:hypothetical protein
MTELERCDVEIREIERLLRAGHPDMEGLLLALSDWRTERRLLIETGEQSLNGEARNDSEDRPG